MEAGKGMGSGILADCWDYVDCNRWPLPNYRWIQQHTNSANDGTIRHYCGIFAGKVRLGKIKDRAVYETKWDR